MHTDDLLQAKYDAQRVLVEKARRAGRPYLEVAEEEARELFRRNGWRLRFAERKGGTGDPAQRGGQ